MFRWVWEHSFTEADFTDWADGYPTAEDNVADCAVMSQDQVGQNLFKKSKKDSFISIFTPSIATIWKVLTFRFFLGLEMGGHGMWRGACHCHLSDG